MFVPHKIVEELCKTLNGLGWNGMDWNGMEKILFIFYATENRNKDFFFFFFFLKNDCHSMTKTVHFDISITKGALSVNC